MRIFRRSKLPNLTARLCAFLCLCALAAVSPALLRSQAQPAPATKVDRPVPVDEPLPPPSAQDAQANDATAAQDDQSTPSDQPEPDQSAESGSTPGAQSPDQSGGAPSPAVRSQPAAAASPAPAVPASKTAPSASDLVAATPSLPKPLPADAGGDPVRQQINNETANLLAMAYALKADVDKTNADTLSIGVVRKANEVEQLARKVLGDMKPVVTSKN